MKQIILLSGTNLLLLQIDVNDTIIDKNLNVSDVKITGMTSNDDQDYLIATIIYER